MARLARLWARLRMTDLAADHEISPIRLEILHQEGDRVFVRGPVHDGERIVRFLLGIEDSDAIDREQIVRMLQGTGSAGVD